MDFSLKCLMSQQLPCLEDIDPRSLPNPSMVPSTATSFAPFKLPIHYQPTTEIRSLTPVVVSDLELAESDTQTPIYEFLFQPSHGFSKKMIQEWKQSISVDTTFLEETQGVVKNMSDLIDDAPPPVDTNRLTAIWNDVKHDPSFLEKYSYMEFEFLKYLNHSESFLQTVTFANIMSPIASFLFPIIILIIPFIILKFQRNSIGFSSYITVLKELTKNHFIGKTITSFQNMNYTNIGYIFGSAMMYLIQLYNNTITCWHFYKNINKINDDMIYLREFIEGCKKNMEIFIGKNTTPKYADFVADLAKHRNVLNKISAELAPISPFSVSFGKFNKVGYMLKSYYGLHSNTEYSDSIQFSFGFEGYIDGMKGVYRNWKEGRVSFGSFSPISTPPTPRTHPLVIKNQYYPPHDKETAVKNTVKLGVTINKPPQQVTTPNDVTPHGLIITGPNASGKTTLLKTTAINVIFTQQTGCGYYSTCSITPYHRIHSYLNIPDTSGRDSLFQAEARRCKEIIDVIKDENEDRHFCMFDELYSGTNPTEASKASFAFLKYLSGFENVVFMLTTHYTCVCKRILKDKTSKIVNYRMLVNETPNEKGEIELIYTYQMERGISKIEGAINVLRSLNYPSEILKGFFT